MPSASSDQNPRRLHRRAGSIHDFAALPAAPYCYVLGLYLGDGCISRSRRVWRLRIVLDKKYPAIIDRCRDSNRHADARPARRDHATAQELRRSLAVLETLAVPVPPARPRQEAHATIALEPWQQALVDTATEEFILGLIHSDGCRVVANDRSVKSIRYHFSNMSEDIHGLFTAALDALGIPWTRSSKKIVSIYRKAATARLDEFVGPKDHAVPLNGVHYTA